MTAKPARPMRERAGDASILGGDGKEGGNGTADNTVFEKNENREGMAKRVGMSRDNGRGRKGWTLTAAVTNIFEFVRLAEFEILFILFLIIAFIIFKDLTSRPEYNQLLVKKPGGVDWWPY